MWIVRHLVVRTNQKRHGKYTGERERLKPKVGDQESVKSCRIIVEELERRDRNQTYHKIEFQIPYQNPTVSRPKPRRLRTDRLKICAISQDLHTSGFLAVPSPLPRRPEPKGLKAPSEALLTKKSRAV